MLSYFLIFCSLFITNSSKKLCFVEENKQENGVLTNYQFIACDSHEHCCKEGCCLNEDSQDLMFKFKNGAKKVPLLWVILFLFVLGYAVLIIRYLIKKICKKETTETISHNNTQPQELNLMLSFNNSPDSLERFNFDNLNGAHIHIPFMPTTPVTPPPSYFSLTPPPNYNVAIHFPTLQVNQMKRVEEEDEEEDKKNDDPTNAENKNN